jgi:hypothetical protein
MRQYQHATQTDEDFRTRTPTAKPGAMTSFAGGTALLTTPAFLPLDLALFLHRYFRWMASRSFWTSAFELPLCRIKKLKTGQKWLSSVVLGAKAGMIPLPLNSRDSGARIKTDDGDQSADRKSSMEGIGSQSRTRRTPRNYSSSEPRSLLVFWVDQMRLCARKARHLDVREVIVFGVISRPTLDVVACVGAALGP